LYEDLVEKFEEGCLFVKGSLKKGRATVTCFTDVEAEVPERLVLDKKGRWLKIYTIPPFYEPTEARVGLHAWVVSKDIRLEEHEGKKSYGNSRKILERISKEAKMIAKPALHKNENRYLKLKFKKQYIFSR